MKQYEQTFTVATYNCGPSGVIRPYALMGHLQQAASVHAEQLGFGKQDLDQLNGYWVLHNFYMQITRLPQVYESYRVRTWPSGNTKLLAGREFEGTCNKESALFQAASEWMILDKQSSRPKNLNRTNLPNLNTGPKLFSESINRLQPQANYTPIQTLQVMHSSLDLNSHVNNTEYVRFAFDALGLDGPIGTVAMQATYLAEVFEHDKLEIQTCQDDSQTQVMICKAEDKTPCFLLKYFPQPLTHL